MAQESYKSKLEYGVSACCADRRVFCLSSIHHWRLQTRLLAHEPCQWHLPLACCLGAFGLPFEHFAGKVGELKRGLWLS